MAIVKVKSPRGQLEWVVISGEGKENLSGIMKYNASVVLDPENVEKDAAFIKQIDDYWAENKPIKKDPKSLAYRPHTVATDETDEDGKPIYVEDGKVVVTFSTATTYPKGGAKVVKVYNAKAKEVKLPSGVMIGNETIGSIAGSMNIYTVKAPKGNNIIEAGVTLYLDAIQINKLVEYSSDPGFEADEADDDDAFTGEDDGLGDYESEESNTAEPQDEKKSSPRL